MRTISDSKKFQEIETRQNSLLQKLMMNDDQYHKALKKLESSVTLLVQEVHDLRIDFDELKTKQNNAIYIVTFIVGRLMQAQQILQKAKHDWTNGKVNIDLLNFFNVSLPCGERCPPHLYKPVNCMMSMNYDRLEMNLHAFHINNSIHHLKADPFYLFKHIGNQSCTIKYIGPPQVVYSELENCIHSVHTYREDSSDLYLIPNKGCNANSSLNTNITQFFELDRCFPRTENDHLDYIQVKNFGKNNYIYCPYAEIELHGRKRKCPDNPFVLPVEYAFKIGNLEYHVDKLVVNKDMITDPKLNLRVNFELKPQSQINEIAKRISEASQELDKTQMFYPYEPYQHPYPVTLTVVLIIIIVFIIAFTIYKLRTARTRQIQIQVGMNRPNNQDEGTEAERIQLRELNV